jgi:hypothetical protein
VIIKENLKLNLDITRILKGAVPLIVLTFLIPIFHFKAALGGGIVNSAFLAPNEEDLSRSHNIYNEVGKGVGIFVGTERGFMTAGISSQMEGLVLIDISSTANVYNVLNIALLRASQGSRKKYLHLRLQSSYEEWLEASLNEKTPEYAILLSDPRLHSWWTTEVRDKDLFNNFHTPKRRVGIRKNPIFNSNYLFNDEYFNRVYKLASQNKIFVYNADLSISDEVRKTLQDISIQFPDNKISFMDISNAWQIGYLGPMGTGRLIRLLTFFYKSDFVLVFTSQAPIISTLPIVKLPSTEYVTWNYHALRLNVINSMRLQKSHAGDKFVFYDLGEHIKFSNRGKIQSNSFYISNSSCSSALSE